jgi:hypothetical protein
VAKASPTQPPLALDSISLRARERGLLVGGTDTGKSTLAEALTMEFFRRYENGRILILDSKPRFRAQYDAHGLSVKRRYKSWSHGPTVPGSAAVASAGEMDRAFSTDRRVLIAQGERSRDIPGLLACAARFLDTSKANRPQLLVVDETMDFFSANGQPRGGDDILTRVARGGRERGTGALYCSQRTRGIPAQLMEEMSRCYLFRLDYKADVKRLYEMGFPPGVTPPTETRAFKYWTKAAYEKVYGPYRLDLSRR